MRLLSLSTLLASLAFLACSSSSGGGGPAPCSDAGTCGPGLVCLSNVCVVPPEGGVGATGGTASGGSAGSSSGGLGGASGASGSGGAAGAGALGGAAGSGGGGPTCTGTPETGGIATEGVNCTAEGSVACAGNAQATVLECDATTCTWQSVACDTGKLCDTTDGSCKTKIAGCATGGAVCINGVRHTCGPDLVSTTPAPCPATAPQCTGAGVCVGCTSPSDCPTPSNPCQNAVCNSGTCGTQSKPTGSGCGSNKVCSASATCGCSTGYQDCDGNGTSCEAYVATDSLNCGTCGKSCQGGTCSNGTCQATPIVTAPSTGVCEPIASDGSYVYFADNSSIRRVPVSGGNSVYLTASGGTVRGLALDASYVYWANLNDLWRAPKVGGTGTILSNLADGSEIVVTSYEVYFADVIGGNIWSVPKTGGSPTLVASGQVQYSGASLAMVFSDMAADNGKVLWTLDGNGFGSGVLRQGSPFGGSYSTLASASRPMAVALEGNMAYWVDGNSGVYDYDTAALNMAYLAPWSTPRYVSDIQVAGSYLYISSANTAWTQTIIERLPKTGGSLSVVAQGTGSPGHMAQDSQAMYFVSGTSIYRFSK